MNYIRKDDEDQQVLQRPGLSALDAYILRIGGERRNFRRIVVVREGRDHYHHDRAIIKINQDTEPLIAKMRNSPQPTKRPKPSRRNGQRRHITRRSEQRRLALRFCASSCGKSMARKQRCSSIMIGAASMFYSCSSAYMIAT
jgi:hypothetical protein